MSDINLVRPYSLPIAVAKARVQKTADELAAEYNLTSEWDGNTLHFDRAGLHGRMNVTHSEIQLEVHLGLLMKPFKGRLISRIEDKFDRLFPELKSPAQKKKPAKKPVPSAR